MSVLEVYDPAMCCSTGVCGPDVDPKLAQFARDLDWLKGQGVEVRRFNLAQEPVRFVEKSAVKSIMDRSGGDELPAIVFEETVAVGGRYPTREELVRIVGLTRNGNQVAPGLSETVKELVAIGAAVAAGCEPCLKFHVDKARKLEVSDAAMREAIEMAVKVKAAATSNMTKLAEKLLPAGAAAPVTTGCCGGGSKASSCC
jgi:AhpD family alkylhydroperoxidase